MDAMDPSEVEGAVPQADGKFELSVERMPRVREFLHCALPILYLDDEHGSWHGVGGSAFFVRYHGRVVVVTAAHCVSATNGSNLAVATLVEAGPLEWIRMRDVFRPSVVDPSSPYNEATDVAVMVPERDPEVDEAHILDFNDISFVDLAKWPIGGLMAASGFPRTGAMKYGDEGGGVYASVQFFALGQYGGPRPSVRACHVMLLTEMPSQGPDGMSGSPVAGCLLEDDGTWKPGLAGMIIQGGGDRLHFLDRRRVFGYVRAAVGLLSR